jgi:hypothetical protein
MTTAEEFNYRYMNYLEEGHYGMDIHFPSVIQYMDKVFQDLIKIPGFKYSQIKLKFSSCRFYSNLYETFPELGRLIVNDVEKEINFLVRIEDEIKKRNDRQTT